MTPHLASPLNAIRDLNSVKEHLVRALPVLNDAAGFCRARRLLREQIGGAEFVSQELSRAGLVDGEGRLTIGDKPFNIFVRLAAGEGPPQPGMDREQKSLGDFEARFFVCRNRPENDEHWNSSGVEWLGKASMARRHRFLTTRRREWQWFNVLTFGMAGVRAADAIEELEAIRAAALTYAKAEGWSERVGLFFHVFGHNSVNSLHLHVLDLDEVGPTFHHAEYKNCPIESVLQGLRVELTPGFGVWSATPQPSQSGAERVKLVFKACDRSGSGTIHRDILSRILEEASKLEGHQVQAVFDRAQIEKSMAEIPYEPFIDFLYSGRRDHQ